MTPLRYMEIPATLYRLFDADDGLLYVGVSVQVAGRIHAHRSGRDWWMQVARATFEHFETRREALAAEARAVADEQPRFNVMDGGYCGRRRNQWTNDGAAA